MSDDMRRFFQESDRRIKETISRNPWSFILGVVALLLSCGIVWVSLVALIILVKSAL